MRNSLYFKGALLLSAFALWGAGCGQPPAPITPPVVETPKEDIVIGATLPLTGELAEYGDSWRKAMELGVEEVNQDGGIDGHLLKLVVEDDKCDPVMASSTVSKLMTADKAMAVVGPACDDAVLAAAPLAELNSVPMLAIVAASPKITSAGSFIFRLAASDALRIKALTQTIYSENATDPVFSIFWENTDYHASVRDAFRAFMTDKGAKLEIDEAFATSSNDFEAMAEKVEDVPVVVVSANTELTAQILKELKAQKYAGKIYVSLDQMNNDVIKNTAAEGAEGVKFAVFSPASGANFDKFAAAYQSVYNEAPKNSATQAYDAVKILANAMKTKGANSADIASGLFEVQGYKGASGDITMDENGDLLNKLMDYRMMHFKDGALVSETLNQF